VDPAASNMNVFAVFPDVTKSLAMNLEFTSVFDADLAP
jgi:hypothetical protein